MPDKKASIFGHRNSGLSSSQRKPCQNKCHSIISTKTIPRPMPQHHFNENHSKPMPQQPLKLATKTMPKPMPQQGFNENHSKANATVALRRKPFVNQCHKASGFTTFLCHIKVTSLGMSPRPRGAGPAASPASAQIDRLAPAVALHQSAEPRDLLAGISLFPQHK